MFATKSKIVQPELLAGEGSVIIEPLNQTNDPFSEGADPRDFSPNALLYYIR